MAGAPSPPQSQSPGRSPRTPRSPRTAGCFAKANITSVLPEFINAEQDYIRNAFTPGNSFRIKTLPDKLGYSKVNKNRSVERLSQLGPRKAHSVTRNLTVETQATRCLLPMPGTPGPIPLPPTSPRNFVGGEPPAFCIPQSPGTAPLSNRSFGEYAYHESAYDAAELDIRRSAARVSRPLNSYQDAHSSAQTISN